MNTTYLWRTTKSQVFINIIRFFALLGALPFFLITFYVFQKGISAINWDFFTALPKPTGELGGGIANALWGTCQMVFVASLVAVPWGIASGIYLSEFGYGKTAFFLRMAVDLLTSVPSIVVGIFIYSVLVVTIGHFSGWAGSMALAVIMLPFIARSSEEMFKLVPVTVREAGLALGLPRWKVIYRIVVPAAFKGVLTSVMLAVARVTGETAPLLFTAFGNQYFNESLREPTASLPVQVYNFASSGYEDLQRQAWAGALVLVLFVLSVNLITRLLLSRERK
jgi:phosphate transport system permease protein